MHHVNTDPQCEIQLVGKSIQFGGFSLPVRKGSLLKKVISPLIRKYELEGFIEQLTKRWFHEKCVGINPAKEAHGFSVAFLSGATLALIGGFLLSLLVLIVEKCAWKIFPHDSETFQ